MKLFVLYLSAVTLLASAAGVQAPPDVDCNDPLGTMPSAIKGVLSPLRVHASDRARLSAAAQQLTALTNSGGDCRIRLQGDAQGRDKHGNSHREQIRDWISLNQWLDRLTSFVAMNAEGDLSVDWQDEYVLFAEIYEFEI
jgi:hypothetical protein